MQIPHFRVTYEGRFPDKVKLKKTIHAWPVQATGALVWDDHTMKVSHRFAVKVRVTDELYYLNIIPLL